MGHIHTITDQVFDDFVDLARHDFITIPCAYGLLQCQSNLPGQPDTLAVRRCIACLGDVPLIDDYAVWAQERYELAHVGCN
jgi:hypothetical protein